MSARALVVYAHPKVESYSAAIRDLVLDRLTAAGAEIRLIDLYARGFDPILGPGEFAGYESYPGNLAPVAQHVEDLRWAETLIFVYPTWWYGLPAMLKGWLDRVLLPGVAFTLPSEGDIRPGLQHITRLGVYTTCGASWWLTRFVGAPGKRTLLTGVRILCHRRVRTSYAAHYSMDASTAESRAHHLHRVARAVDRLMAGTAKAGRAGPEPAPAASRT
ncbi:MAG: NAD(P)H-dependent oxidoreductase [Pseudomonadota bacterium]